jgi:hypothetical protein
MAASFYRCLIRQGILYNVAVGWNATRTSIRSSVHELIHFRAVHVLVLNFVLLYICASEELIQCKWTFGSSGARPVRTPHRVLVYMYRPARVFR